jgi:hypothetical protein
VEFGVNLGVSKGGGWLSPRRSYVEIGGADWDCSGLTFHLGRGGHPVRIRPDGRFRYVRTRDRFELRVFGRFTTRNLATVSFRYLRQPRRPAHPCDDSGRFTVSPRRAYDIPFHDCLTHHAKTVLSAPTGRVFWQPLWDERDGWTTTAYACLFSVNKRFKLDQDQDDDSDLDLFRLVGPYVAYQQAACSMGCGFSLHVRDLRDGSELRTVPTPFHIEEFIGRVTSLELKDNGSIGWINLPPPYTIAPPSVSAYDSLGRRLLDSGNIALDSLTLSGSTLSWIKDGLARSATLD